MQTEIFNAGVVFAVLLIAMTNGTARAEWVEIDHSDIQTTYADPSSANISGSRATIWLLSSYKAPRKYDDKKFQSVLSQYEYECRDEQFRMLAYSLRFDKTGKGEELHSEAGIDKWKRIIKGSIDETLWKKLCTPDAGWSRVGESEKMLVYANPYTARKKGGKVKMWELFDFKSVQQREGKKYLSIRHQAEYDCKEKLYRTLEVAYHAENMGKGKEVSDDDRTKKWEAVAEGSADRVFWGMVCGGPVEP